MKNGLYIDKKPTSLPYFIVIDGSRTKWSTSIEDAINHPISISLEYTKDWEWLGLLYEFDSIEEFKEKYPEEFI